MQTALGAASSGDELWVVAGVYVPTTTTDRTISFDIPADVAVYGGFLGTEVTRDQRDPAANPTVLSGDIDSNDTDTDTDTDTDGNQIAETTADIQGANSHHVLVMDGASQITASTVLDGFTITAGDALGLPDSFGGGLLCWAVASGSSCSATLTQLAFGGNRARRGGAIYNIASGGTASPTITDVTFTGNPASQYGGAIYNWVFQGTASPTITNVTFSGNSAGGDGGAIFNRTVGGTANPTLTNIVLWGNTATYGSDLLNVGGTVQLESSVASACPVTIVGCPNLVTADPRLGPLQDNGGPTATMALGAGSSAIDAGDLGICPAADQRGVVRPQDGDGDAVAGCDIGAFEVDPPPSVTVDFRVVAIAEIPTLGVPGIALMSLLLAAAGLGIVRRRETNLAAKR